jgi:hypothetical protein
MMKSNAGEVGFSLPWQLKVCLPFGVEDLDARE